MLVRHSSVVLREVPLPIAGGYWKKWTILFLVALFCSVLLVETFSLLKIKTELLNSKWVPQFDNKMNDFGIMSELHTHNDIFSLFFSQSVSIYFSLYYILYNIYVYIWKTEIFFSGFLKLTEASVVERNHFSSAPDRTRATFVLGKCSSIQLTPALGSAHFWDKSCYHVSPLWCLSSDVCTTNCALPSRAPWRLWGSHAKAH